MSTTNHGRRRPAAALAAVLALTLSACATAVPEPQPVELTEPVPVVTTAQLDRVAEQVNAVLAAGDAAGDANQLAPRVEGAALQFRQAQYAVRAQVPTHPLPPTVGTNRLVDMVPADQDWPRFVVTVTEPAEGEVPQIQVLSQADARTPYRYTAGATMLPGVTLPRTAPAQEGVQALPATDASDLKHQPQDAIAGYAAVLTNGAADPNVVHYAEDAFRAAVLTEQDAERTAAGTTCPACFNYAVSHVPREGAVWSVRSEDGGAIVTAVLDSTRTFTVAAAGAKLPISGDLAVLAGKTEAAQAASITSLEFVVLHVPPADSDAQVTVLAAERGPVAVTAS